MNVRELIEELSKLDPETIPVIWNDHTVLYYEIKGLKKREDVGYCSFESNSEDGDRYELPGKKVIQFRVCK